MHFTYQAHVLSTNSLASSPNLNAVLLVCLQDALRRVSLGTWQWAEILSNRLARELLAMQFRDAALGTGGGPSGLDSPKPEVRNPGWSRRRQPAGAGGASGAGHGGL